MDRARKKYVRKTLKTRDLASAIDRGKKIYLEYEHNVRSGKKIFGLTARELVDQFLAYQQERVNTGLITQGRFSTIGALSLLFRLQAATPSTAIL